MAQSRVPDVRRVEDVRVGAIDCAGKEILGVYALSPPHYAVYRTAERVNVQFADDEEEARRQHVALAPLNPLRGQINGLINGWRDDESEGGAGISRDRWKAGCYDKRVADALTTGLENGGADALALLGEIRDDIVAERKSIATTYYLAVAAVASLALTLLLWLFSAIMCATHTRCLSQDWGPILLGAIGGTIGAFFSIATGMRNRTILIDLRWLDNLRDALLRVVVGTIGGAIFVGLLLSGMVSISGVTNHVTDMLFALLVGFAGGFSERRVQDLLGSTSLLAADPAKASNDKAKTMTIPAPAPPPTTPAGSATTPPAPTEDDQIDSCMTHAPVAPEEATGDADLPQATGGVVAKEGE